MSYWICLHDWILNPFEMLVTQSDAEILVANLHIKIISISVTFKEGDEIKNDLPNKLGTICEDYCNKK